MCNIPMNKVNKKYNIYIYLINAYTVLSENNDKLIMIDERVIGYITVIFNSYVFS
jgi:hypothetical protein